MAVGRHPLVAHEGRWHIASAVIAAGAVHYYFDWMWALPLWGLAILVTVLFRDPPRTIPADPLGVVCPADGRVVAVEETRDPYLDRPAKCVSVVTSLLSVYTHRSPVEGKIMEAWYKRGGLLPRWGRTASEADCNALWIQTDEGDDVVTVQLAGPLARRILCYKQPGERIGQGERYGYLRFGSRVDVYMPITSRVTVTLGEKVNGGSDLIAFLVRSGQAAGGG